METKTIHYLDADGNPLSVEAAANCTVFIGNISEGFNMDLTNSEGETTEYEVYLSEGGPLLRPRRPR